MLIPEEIRLPDAAVAAAGAKPPAGCPQPARLQQGAGSPAQPRSRQPHPARRMALFATRSRSPLAVRNRPPPHRLRPMYKDKLIQPIKSFDFGARPFYG